ncbi:hypothetical protein OQA88_2643 [Cercophora sp. LCS_1]
MADIEEDNTKVTSLWPDPPLFWKAHTPENKERWESLRNLYATQNGLDPATVLRIPDCPEELEYLQPPAEPADGKWRLYGQNHSLDDELLSLEQAGIQRLGDGGGVAGKDGKHMDRAFELKRLAKSMLLNFLELTGVMHHNPSHAEEKVQDIKTLLLNFHHILNEYRPHQAREQLIQLMQEQLDSKRAETAAIRSVVDKAKRELEGLGSMEIPFLEETPSAANKAAEDELKAEEAEAIATWRYMETCD